MRLPEQVAYDDYLSGNRTLRARLLDVGDGQQVYWEACGNPDGLPALYLHGGPGSGCSRFARRYFDPSVYRIVLFDQRNCGRSLPNAADMETDLETNTTWHLVEDIEKLRRQLQVTNWLLLGTSWGSTLALAYAQTYPACIREIVLAGVTTTRPSEIEWLTHGMASLFPMERDRLLNALPADFRQLGVLEGYHRLLNSPDVDIRLEAACNWHDWEAASILLADPMGLPRRWQNPRYLLTRARIITHYFRNLAWLDDGVLLRNAERLVGIPGVLVQGRLDLEAPLVTAWELSKAWPQSRLVIVENAAHSASHEGLAGAIVDATDAFRKIPQK